MADLHGVLGTGNLGSGQQIVIDMDPATVFKENLQFPLINIISQLPGRTVANPKFEGEETSHFEMTATVNSASAGSAGAESNRTFDDATKVTIDYLVMVGGIMTRVTAVNTSTNVVGLTPIKSAEAVPATTSNEVVAISGIAKEEGYDLGTRRQGLRDNRFNYIQEFSHPFELTETMIASAQYGSLESRLQEEMIRGTRFVNKLLEAALIGGVKEIDTTGTHPRRYAGGVKGEVTTNNFNYSGALSNSSVRTISRTAFNNGNTTKLLFCDATSMTEFEDILQTSVRTQRTETIGGVRFTEYETSFGRWLVRYHPLINSDAHGFNAFYIDIEYLKFVIMRNNGLQTIIDAVRNGANRRTNEIRIKASFDFAYNAAHGTWTKT